jgi:hypothetical protein
MCVYASIVTIRSEISMDKYFSLFVQKFGMGVRHAVVSNEFLDKYNDVLPNGLLGFWREEGWCSYANGLLWTVNPEHFSWLVDGWVRTIPDLPKSDYYVFARSAYGEFYCLSVDSRKILTISCPRAMIVVSKDIFKSEKSAEIATQTFFATARKEQFDFFDDNDQPLFARACEKLGSLSVNEIYGFAPILPMGGRTSIDHLRKINMDVHVDIIRQSATPTMRLL